MGNASFSGKNQMTPEQKSKVYKNMLWIGVGSSTMLFAGLFSAVIVSMKDKFWVHMKMPDAFAFGIAVIILSSLLLIYAKKLAKKNNQRQLKQVVGISLLLGLVFAVFQFWGWSQMLESGNRVKSNVFFNYGAYGSDFVMFKNNDLITHDGAHYFIGENLLSDEDLTGMRALAHQICGEVNGFKSGHYDIKEYGNPFSIATAASDTIASVKLEFIDGKAFLGQNGRPLSVLEQNELFNFSIGVYRNMPYLVLSGDYGKDFTISLNGEMLTFDKKKLFFPEKVLAPNERMGLDATIYQGGKTYHIKDGKIYSEGEEVNEDNFETYIDRNDGTTLHIKNGIWVIQRKELNEVQYNEFYATVNIASSFIWIMTFIHFIHLFLGLIGLTVIYVRSLKANYNDQNQIGLEVGGIFWHFLGALWIILFCFFQFYH